MLKPSCHKPRTSISKLN